MKLRIAPNHGLNPNDEEEDDASSPQKPLGGQDVLAAAARPIRPR